MQVSHPVPRLSFGTGAVPGQRTLPAEIAVALTFNGTTQAVMMATPSDLLDFAYGFTMTEGIASASEILSVEVVELPNGIDLQIWLQPQAEDRLATRRRNRAGPVGCGLCGIESIDEAMRKLQPVPKSSFVMTPSQVMQAIAALPGAQPLHDATRAVHAAGYWCLALQSLREDVGRHNALDKLVGHLVRAGTPPTGAVVLTSRVSIDMVQKVAALGAPILIAVSAPTVQAVTLADQAGITLIALARADRFELFTHTDRIVDEEAHVA
ncbi:MAG: formate dehydrogenase accessory sulfurtransferase FdhD [Alphaproteobacteria bacterium]|jgi:FdhD protein